GDLLYVLEKGNKARLMRLAANSTAAPLPILEIDQPVVALDVSPDGERIAYVAGKLAEGGKGKAQPSLRIPPLSPSTQPVTAAAQQTAGHRPAPPRRAGPGPVIPRADRP